MEDSVANKARTQKSSVLGRNSKGVEFPLLTDLKALVK
jgi:hypothetical protein